MSNQVPPPDPAQVARPAPAPLDNGVLDAFGASGGIAAAAGAAAGLAWAGIGGRIAMRVVFLTSNERVRGVRSDDGFEIGTISGATISLLIVTTILGGIAGLGVGLIRMVTSGPTWAVFIGTRWAPIRSPERASCTATASTRRAQPEEVVRWRLTINAASGA